MGRKVFSLFFVFLMTLLTACAVMMPRWRQIELTPEQKEVAKLLKIRENYLKKLIAKPLYKFTPSDLNVYLGYLQSIEPDLRMRIQHLARKALNQPYEIYLLGEFPFEIYDAQPLFTLKKSDCVVFSEHIYAMALSWDWKSFFAMLQRIRYKNGIIGYTTRNHYTEFDWDVNNSWLVEDITEQLGGEDTIYETSIVDRAKFMSKYGIGQNIPVDTVKWCYIPYQILPRVIDKLQPGDFVNIVRGNGKGKWVGHVGLIARGKNGTVDFIHSASPKVREVPLMEYVNKSVILNEERKALNAKIAAENEKIRQYNQRLREKNGGKKSPKEKKLKPLKPYFYGFKFLRLRKDPVWELMLIDGMKKPAVQISPVFQ